MYVCYDLCKKCHVCVCVTLDCIEETFSSACFWGENSRPGVGGRLTFHYTTLLNLLTFNQMNELLFLNNNNGNNTNTYH